MTTDPSLFSYFINAGPVVKLIMLLLITVSVASWTVIFQRRFVLKQARAVSQTFEDEFWSGIDFSKLYTQMSNRKATIQGLPAIFLAGFKEFARLKQQPAVPPSVILDGVQRGMRIAYAKEADRLEQHLSFLATVGSTSPYVGLLGTVWGIMELFMSMANSGSSLMVMKVAPGIAGALLTTVVGLLIAMPSAIIYNILLDRVKFISVKTENFSEELITAIARIHTSSSGNS